jgi:hypothetical protein
MRNKILAWVIAVGVGFFFVAFAATAYAVNNVN